MPFKMNLQLPSTTHERARTRTSLRDRLGRFLPQPRSQTIKRHPEITLADEALLRLLMAVRIEYKGMLDNARSAYNADATADAPCPTFDDLVEAGWIRVDRGRIHVSVDAARAAKSYLGGNFATFSALQQQQYEKTYFFEQVADPELENLKHALEAREATLWNISSPRTDWVIVRVWEELLRRSKDDQEALEDWLRLREEIGRPHVVPTDSWAKPIADRFHEAGVNLLESEPYTGWDDIVERLAREIATASHVEITVTHSYFLPVPASTIGRYLWLTSNRHERAFFSGMWALEELAGLVSILMSDVEQSENAAPPHPLFDKVMHVVERSPELMFPFFLFQTKHPLLLADMLFRPSTSALACLLIWKWQRRSDAWTDNVHRIDDERNKAALFGDVVSILRYLLDAEAIHPAEVAELLIEVFRYQTPTPSASIESTNAMRQQLLDELAAARTDSLLKVLETLFFSIAKSGPGSGAFDSALALIDASHLTSLVDPAPLVLEYTAAMSRDDFALSPHQISASQAKTLYDLAGRSGVDIETRFLDPLRVPERISERLRPNANPYTIADAISRTVRAHTRILSRAIVGHSGEVPDKLVDALVKTVETGAFSRAERNRVDAFSAQYEDDFLAKSPDRSISADLGQTLSKLSRMQRSKLLPAILQIEEPLALARLLPFVPKEVRGEIRQRITRLTPENSTALYRYTAVQMRIEQLLEADFPDVAAAFLDRELEVTTSWRFPGRAINRIRQQLRLHLLRKEWEQIHAFSVPEYVPDDEKQAAQETIEFYRGLASLKRTAGDLKDAEVRFAKLQRSHPHVPAYTVNLHATRVSSLLDRNAFGYIEHEKYPNAAGVIAAGNEALSSFGDLSPDDEAILRVNNALLLLAMRQPDRALAVLDEIPPEARRLDSTYAYRAISLARTGQPSLAAGVLEAGEAHFGRTVALGAVREHMENAAPYPGRANSTSDQDIVPAIKRALQDLMLLNPGEQARALTAGNGNMAGYLLTQMREATSAIVDLASTMRALDADSTEDDITGFLNEILHARLRHIRWFVSDQGKGGYTAAGNPGEREISRYGMTRPFSLWEKQS
jgi:hypothetical protein